MTLVSMKVQSDLRVERMDEVRQAVCRQTKGLTIIKQKLVAWCFAGPLFFCNFVSAF